jgi:hypothetical protein
VDWLNKVTSRFITMDGVTQSVGAKSWSVDLFVGGLLLVLAVGGLAM